MIIGFIAALVAVVAAITGLVWWWRSRRQKKRRQAQRAFYALSEEIITAGSPEEIAERLNAVLPSVTEATSAQLYLYNRATKCLERVRTSASPEPVSAPVDHPPSGLAAGAVASFTQRKLISVPDVRRSPVIKVVHESSPRAAVFVPLLGTKDRRGATNTDTKAPAAPLAGVLEVDNADSFGFFTTPDLTAFQHLANQAAAALLLQQQQAMREQLFRGEKVAATGQLISGVASELSKPLENIEQLTRLLADYSGQPVPEQDIDLLKQEAKRASDIVHRLVSFSQQESATPARVDIAAVLNGLIRFREAEWRTQGLRLQNHVRAGRCAVLGIDPQLEQVLLTLLVHAEQRASDSPSKLISVTTGVIDNRVVVDIDYGAPDDAPEPDPFAEESEGTLAAGALGLAVCRSIISNHGGEIRMHRRSGLVGFEVELPALAEEPTARPRSAMPSPIEEDTPGTGSSPTVVAQPDPDAGRSGSGCGATPDHAAGGASTSGGPGSRRRSRGVAGADALRCGPVVSAHG